MAKGLEFQGSYTFSKSIDYNSRNVQGVVVQDSYNFRNDRGLSDFDARHRLVFNGIYELPFKGNQLKAGWELTGILTLQSGSPLNFFTSNRSITGAGTVRASVNGPVNAGLRPASNGNAIFEGYVDKAAFYDQTQLGGTFGNLGRNAIEGPGFANLDLALVKNFTFKERFRFQVRADAFDSLNHPNFGNPASTVGSGTFGLISSTRFPPGDSGSSRQMQLAAKFQF